MRPINILHILITIVLFFTAPAFGTPNTRPAGPDPALLTPAAALMQMRKKKAQVFLVDIRPKKEFSAFKIPGSLNIPAALIKTKAFLKTGRVILVHQGVSHNVPAGIARDLNTKGFNASVLLGGLASWQHKGGELVGNPFALKTLNTVSCRTFFSGMHHEDWIVINLSQTPSLQSIIPMAIVPETNKSTPPDSVSLASLPALQQLKDTTSIIIADDTGRDYARIIQQLPAPYRHKAFGLTGGIPAFQNFLTTHMLANRPKAQRTVETGDCDPCKKRQAQ